jgi:tetratricopeptide (TPR) repeat protein
VAANPLKQLHESALLSASQQLASALTPDARRQALQLEVAALNSLGRSEEALQKLDAAEAGLAAPQRSADLRAKVLLPLGRCDEAMPQLQAAIDAKDAAARQLMGAAYQPGGLVFMAAEELLAQTYCLAAQRRHDDAVASLSRVSDPMDPSLLHYRAAWYVALRKLGAAPRASLDAAAEQLPRNAGNHDLSLAVASGRMEVKHALEELRRRRPSPVDAQDAQAEILFFAAVAANSPEARAALLDQLDALSAFGSTEWVMSKLLFPAR